MILNLFKKKSNIVFICILLLSVVLEASFRLSESFSELFCTKLVPVFRLLYYPFSLVPFSVAETAVILAFVLICTFLTAVIINLFFKAFKKSPPFRTKPMFFIIIRTAIILFFLFVTTFSSAYHRTSVAEQLNLKDGNISVQEIEKATLEVALQLNKVSEQIPFVSGELSKSDMSFSQMSEHLKSTTDKACVKYPFLQKGGAPAKPIALSVPMTYTHISGIYTFFTGEPCINTNYADYTLPYTIAHEYSHQRGIGAEDEADFTAFLICMQSDDPYVRYSALSQVFITLSNELYDTNREAYVEIVRSLPLLVINDYYVSSEYYSKYSDSVAGEVASEVNNAYLKANGVESGVKSYSESVVLLVKYLNS